MTPKEQITVSLVQPNVHWEDRAANLLHLSSLLASVENTDLIILPEMFPTGFSMRPQDLAEESGGVSTQWMVELAQAKDSYVVGSIITHVDGHYFNRLIWMHPDGSYQHYDKRHLFSFANEHEHYQAGAERIITDLYGWRVCPLICYDLRFPVWSRNQALDGSSIDSVFDLQIFVANWPEARRKPWMNLLEARAHENQCYVIGVNRVGVDGNGIQHSGDSAAYDPKGELLSNMPSGEEAVQHCVLDFTALTAFREKFTAWKDKDNFKLS